MHILKFALSCGKGRSCPFKDIAAHVESSVGTLAVFDGIYWLQFSWYAIGPWLLTPGICAPICSFCRFFPLLFCGQPLAGPGRKRLSIVKGHAIDRVIRL